MNANTDNNKIDAFFTVPWDPTMVNATTVSTSSLQVALSYDYTASEAQCTHYLVQYWSDSPANALEETVPCTEPAMWLSNLTADTLHTVDVSVVSDYSDIFGDGLEAESQGMERDKAWTRKDSSYAHAWIS